MDSEQQALDALRTISQAKMAARRNGPNNGVILLALGAMAFFCLAAFDLIPPIWAVGLCFIVPLAVSAWAFNYQRRLPVKPLRMEKSVVCTLWGFYHAVVLMGGMALGTHFWRTNSLPHGEWTLMGLLDAAPLLWVGWRQRRACGGL